MSSLSANLHLSKGVNIFACRIFPPTYLMLFAVSLQLGFNHTVANCAQTEKPYKSIALKSATKESRRIVNCISFGSARFRHFDSVLCVGCCARAPIVASASKDGTIRIWQQSTGKEIKRLCDFEFPTQVAFAPDGKHLCVSDLEGVWLVDWKAVNRRYLLAKSKQLRLGKNLYFPVETASLSFSFDGKYLGAIDQSACLRVWEVAKKRQILTKNGQKFHFAEANPALMFSPNNSHLSFTTGHRKVQIVDLNTGELVRTCDCKRNVLCVAFSVNGKRLITSGIGNAIQIWNPATGKLVRKIKAPDVDCRRLVFAPDGSVFACGHDNGTIYIRSWPAGGILRQFQGPSTGIMDMAFSKDGGTLFAVGEDEAIYGWSAATGRAIVTSHGHMARVVALSFHPNSNRLVSFSRDGMFCDFDLEKKQIQRQERVCRAIRQAAFSSNGEFLATSQWNGSVTLWRMSSADFVVQRHTSLKWRHLIGSLPCSLSYFAPGHGRMILKEVDSNKRLFALDSQAPRCVCTSHDGTYMGIGYWGFLSLWDLRRGKLVWKMPNANSPSACAFTTDARLMAVANVFGKGRVKVDVVETYTGKTVRSILADKHLKVHAMSTLGYNQVACGFSDGAIHIWNLWTGKVIDTIQGSNGAVTALNYSDSGSVLAAGYSNSTVSLFEYSDKHSRRPEKIHSKTERLEWLWRQLALESPREAYLAFAEYIDSPSQTINFFAKKLKSVSAPEMKTVLADISNLSSEKYRVRRQAFAKLLKAHDSVIPILEKKLRENPSLQARLLIEELIRKAMIVTPKQLQTLRAIHILECTQRSEAKTIIKKIAKGSPSVLLIKWAESTLKRME